MKASVNTPRRKPAGKPRHPADPKPVYEDDVLLEQEDFLDADGLREAEEDLGISDWIDPDTGEPAEDTWHHIEDH